MSRITRYGLPLALFGLTLAGCAESRRGPVAITPADTPTDSGKIANRGNEGKKEEKKGKYTDLADIHAEVSVLQTLRWLDLSDRQLETLSKLAGKTAMKPPPRREIQVSMAFRTALLDLRSALRAGDEKKIETAMSTLDALREEDDPEFDAVEITEAARKEAAVLFDSLNARQIVSYLSGLGEGFPDPMEMMTQALAQTREKRGKEWRAYRDDIAVQVAWLIGGLDSSKEEMLLKKVTALLDRAHDLTDKQFSEQKTQLEQSARELAGNLRSLDIIRHYLERVLAETLSNDQLAAAVEGLQKRRGAKRP